MIVRSPLRALGMIICAVLLVLPAALCFRGPHAHTSKSIELLHVLTPVVLFVLFYIGIAEGRARERVDGLRLAVRSLCRVLSIPVTPSRQEDVWRMDAAELDALRERLERERRWD
jgi:hypothetical protein